MRIVFVTILCCITSFSSAQAPDYFANDPQWVCGFWNSNQWNPPYIESNANYVYYLNGDTLINNLTFHRLFSKGKITYTGPYPTNYFDSFTGYYLRQDNKNIRYYTNQLGSDSLLVSYDYQTGDTVKGGIFQQCYAQSTIQKIDSISINSEFRKVFYIDSITGPAITEGIGHQVLKNGPFGEFIYPLCQGIGFDYYIHCFALDTISFWSASGSGVCDLNVSINEPAAENILVYPNPFDLFLNVKSLRGEVSEIFLYDVAGRIIFRNQFIHEVQLPVSMLEKGIYFYEVRAKDNLFRNGKIIKK